MGGEKGESGAAELAVELRVVLGKIKRWLREQPQVGDLTWSQVSVLSRLDRQGPATVTALARMEGMRPQSMGAIVSALEAAGFVSGAPDPADGRQTILSVTDACRRWIADRRAQQEDWLLRAIESSLTEAEQTELASAARLLGKVIDSKPAEGERVTDQHPATAAGIAGLLNAYRG